MDVLNHFHRLRREIKPTNGQLNEFQNGISLPKIWFDSTFKCIEANSSAQEFFQMSFMHLRGLSLAAIFFELKTEIHSFEQLTALGRPVELWLTNGGGEQKCVYIFSEKMSQFRPERYELAFVDLTHQKKDFTKLIEAESRYRTFANAIPQLAWMADSAGSVFWHNERFFEFTGSTSGGILGFSWMDIIAPHHRDKFVELVHVHISSGLHAEAILKIKSRDHEFQWCLVRAIPIKNQKGEVLRWFGTATPLPEILTTSIPSEGHIPTHPSAFNP